MSGDPLQDLPPLSSPFWASTNSFGRGFNVPPGSGVDRAAGDRPGRRSMHGFTFGPGGFNAWFGPRGFDGSWGGWGGPGGGGGGGGGGGSGRHPFGGRRRRNDLNTAAADAADDLDHPDWGWTWSFPAESGRDAHHGAGSRWGRFGRRASAGEPSGFGGHGFGGAGPRRRGGHWGYYDDEVTGDAYTGDAPAAAATTAGPGHDDSSDSDTSTTVDRGATPDTPTTTTDRPATPSTTDFAPDPPEAESLDPSRPRGGPGLRGHHGHRCCHHRGGHRARGHIWSGPRAGCGRRSRDLPEGAAPTSPPPTGGPGEAAIDLSAMMRSLGLEHLQPYVQGLERGAHYLRNYVPGVSPWRRPGPRSGVRGPASSGDGADANAGRDEDQAFVPPVDIFNQVVNWTVHVALPGSKKEDIAVNWDAGRSDLVISGIVHRPGDEEFLKCLVSGERRVGLFERRVRLPPDVEENKDEKAEGPEEEEKLASPKDEVDADNITARMEDGVLIVVIPKIEKWTQVRKVDIQ